MNKDKQDIEEEISNALMFLNQEEGTDDWRAFICSLKDYFKNYPEECDSLNLDMEEILKLERRNARIEFRDFALKRIKKEGSSSVIILKHVLSLAQAYDFTPEDLI